MAMLFFLQPAAGPAVVAEREARDGHVGEANAERF